MTTQKQNQIEADLADPDRIIAAIFDLEPVSSQPKYIVGLDCWDDAALRRLCGIIKRKTLRGTMLETAPLQLICVNGQVNEPTDGDGIFGGIECLFVSTVEQGPGELRNKLL